MFNWDLIFKHEQRMEELAIERLKLEVEKLRLEAELAKAKKAATTPVTTPNVFIAPKGFDINLHPNRRRDVWGRR